MFTTESSNSLVALFMQIKRITLNVGPAGRAGWRAVLPNEKYEGQWDAHRRAGGLHIKLGCEKGRLEGCPFLQPALLCSPPTRPSVFCAARRKLTFFIWKHGPPARPAHRPPISVIQLKNNLHLTICCQIRDFRFLCSSKPHKI